MYVELGNCAYSPAEEDLIPGFVYGDHDDYRICAGMCEIMKTFPVVEYSGRTVKGERNSYPVGHGFLPVLSAQGSRVEQEIFHPPHMEYVGEPQAGQNYELGQLRP
jgi:hypothetical protein